MLKNRHWYIDFAFNTHSSGKTEPSSWEQWNKIPSARHCWHEKVEHFGSIAAFCNRTRKWCRPTIFGHVPSSSFDYELLLMSRFFFGRCQIDVRFVRFTYFFARERKRSIGTYYSSRSFPQILGRNCSGTPGIGPSWRSVHRSLRCDTEKTHKGSSGRRRHTCLPGPFQVLFRSVLAELRNRL